MHFPYTVKAVIATPSGSCKHTGALCHIFTDFKLGSTLDIFDMNTDFGIVRIFAGGFV